MAINSRAFYEYETSPRKLEPNYKVKKKNKTQVKKTNLQIKKDRAIFERKMKVKACLCVFLIFIGVLVITYRNSQIDESFMKVKGMQAELALLNKENEQLRVNIENSFNLSTVEQEAKEQLGMQKLENSQKEYMTLSGDEYVEAKSKKIIIDKEKTWYEKIIDIITNLW